MPGTGEEVRAQRAQSAQELRVAPTLQHRVPAEPLGRPEEGLRPGAEESGQGGACDGPHQAREHDEPARELR